MEQEDLKKSRDPNSTIRFFLLIIAGMFMPLLFRFILNGYFFFRFADITMPILVIVTALSFYSRDAASSGFNRVRIPFLISGLLMLAVALIAKPQSMSLYLPLWQGTFGFLMALNVLFMIVLMSHRNRNRVSNENLSKEIGDTNLIFIFLAIVPVLATTSIYVTGNGVSSYWGSAMIPSTTGFLLGGLAIQVGSIVKSMEDPLVAIVAALMMFILGYLLFIVSLPFVLESASTADYIALFEIFSPLYLFSLIAVIPQERGSASVISKIFGFNLQKNTKTK